MEAADQRDSYCPDLYSVMDYHGQVLRLENSCIFIFLDSLSGNIC